MYASTKFHKSEKKSTENDVNDSILVLYYSLHVERH